MSHTDPIADMLTRVRNANKALHAQVEMPSSGQKVELARLLKDEGYIASYSVEKEGSFDKLVVELKYTDGRRRVITAGEKGQQAGPPHLCKERQPPQGPWWFGDGRHLHLEWPDDGSGGSTARSRRRSRLLRLVTPCLG